MYKRLRSIEAATQFVEKYFPSCEGALLAGSVVRGQATETSDLDIVVFDQTIVASYRESIVESEWPIELFAHNLTSYRHFFEMDCNEAKPSMPTMVSEGLIIRDVGVIDKIKEEANQLLVRGPESWTQETIKLKRYFITDTLEDLIGCQDRGEAIFIAGELGPLLSEFILRTNGQWIGSSKWIVRSLIKYDTDVSRVFVEAFDHFYRTNHSDLLVKLVDNVLQPYGGRLFAGFSVGKDN